MSGGLRFLRFGEELNEPVVPRDEGPPAELSGADAIVAGGVELSEALDAADAAESGGHHLDEADGGLSDGGDPRPLAEGEEVVEGAEPFADLVLGDAGLLGEPAELFVLAVGEVEAPKTPEE